MAAALESQNQKVQKSHTRSLSVPHRHTRFGRSVHGAQAIINFKHWQPNLRPTTPSFVCQLCLTCCCCYCCYCYCYCCSSCRSFSCDFASLFLCGLLAGRLQPNPAPLKTLSSNRNILNLNHQNKSMHMLFSSPPTTAGRRVEFRGRALDRTWNRDIVCLCLLSAFLHAEFPRVTLCVCAKVVVSFSIPTQSGSPKSLISPIHVDPPDPCRSMSIHVSVLSVVKGDHGTPV